MQKSDLSPRFLGIGGFAAALLQALSGVGTKLPKFYLSPLSFPLWLIALVLCPPLAVGALLLGQALASGHKPSFKAKLPADFLSQAALWLLYLLGCAALFYVTAQLMQAALDTYLEAAAASGRLQIGTPEQGTYAAAVLFYAQCAVAAYLMWFFLICCLSLSRRRTAAGWISSALGAFLKNLPGLLFIIILTVLVFMLIERWYAAERVGEILHPEHSLWQQIFPYVFIALRLFVIYAAAAALLKAAAAALGFGELKLPQSRRDPLSPDSARPF